MLLIQNHKSTKNLNVPQNRGLPGPAQKPFDYTESLGQSMNKCQQNPLVSFPGPLRSQEVGVSHAHALSSIVSPACSPATPPDSFHMHVCTYACMHMCMYVSMYARMYVCMHACIYVHCPRLYIHSFIPLHSLTHSAPSVLSEYPPSHSSSMSTLTSQWSCFSPSPRVHIPPFPLPFSFPMAGIFFYIYFRRKLMKIVETCTTK